MTDHCRRNNSEFGQEPSVADRQGDKDGLDHADFVEPVCVLSGIGLQLRDDGVIDARRRRSIAFFQRSEERRMTGHQLPRHADPLAALTRTHEADLRRGLVEHRCAHFAVFREVAQTSTSAALVSAANAARWDSAVRRRTAVQQMSPIAGAAGDSIRSAISAASRRKACGLRAENGRRTAGTHRWKGTCSTEGGGERASSSTTWAFVPEMPSAVTPATPRPSFRGSGVTSPGMISASSVGVSNGFGAE